ncbi:MAG: hypothetical protein HUU38_27410 [Anaerolineales bacterium]|nr:hypothetical protein [Anaerolineales bacterium]
MQNNPLKYVDPSGHIACELVGECNSDEASTSSPDSENDIPVPDKEEWDRADWEAAGVIFDVASGLKAEYIDQIINALNMVKNVLGSRTLSALGLVNGGSLKFIFIGDGRANAPGWEGEVRLGIKVFTATPEHIVHELGHIVDYNAGPGGINNLYTTSSGCSKDVCKSSHNVWRWNTGWEKDSDGNFLYTGDPLAASTGYGLDNPGLGPAEDFAETFTWYIYTQNGQKAPPGYREPSAGRIDALKTIISHFP